jgi:hypothetical protein
MEGRSGVPLFLVLRMEVISLMKITLNVSDEMPVS